MQQIEKTFTMTVHEQFAVTRQIFIKTTAAKLFYGFFIGVPPLFGLALEFSGYGLDYTLALNMPFSWLGGMMLAYALVIQPYSQYLEVKRTFTNNAAAQAPQNCILSAEDFANSGEGFDLSVGWDKVLRIETSKDYLLLFISKRSAYFVPLTQLSSEEIDQIRSWHRAGVGKSEN